MKTKAQILKDSGIDIRLTDQNYLKSISEAMQTYADQENAELKEAAVLSADAIGLLQYEMGQLRSEIALLRSRLDECRRKQMMG